MNDHTDDMHMTDRIKGFIGFQGDFGDICHHVRIGVNLIGCFLLHRHHMVIIGMGGCSGSGVWRWLMDGYDGG